MATLIRIPLLVLVCLGLSSLCPAAQQQGQILERRASAPTTADVANAAQAMQIPVLGFVYGADRDEQRPRLGSPGVGVSGERGELRPILGIPGASVLGEPLAVPAGVTGVYFAPGQNYALLAQRTGSFIGLMTFQGAGEGPVIAICGAISQPDIVSFSPSGNTVTLYSTAEEQLQVITGLPDSPQLARVIPRSDLPDEIRFLAVADDGVTLLEGTVRSAVYLLPEVGPPRFLHNAGDLGGLAFVPRANDVVVYDREAGTAFLLHEVSTASSYFLLAEGLAGVGERAFLQVSSGSAVITGANTSNLWEINLQSLLVQNLHLPGTPLMLQPLRTSGKYLLFYQSGLPTWILDTSGEAGAISFVPASTKARARPRPVPLSTNGGSLEDASEQPDLVTQPGIGSGCPDAGPPHGRPRPVLQPRH